jgi:hypothetical protein
VTTSNPLGLTVSVSNTVLTPIGGTWLAASLSGTGSTQTLTITGTAGSLPNGTYTGQVVLNASNGSNYPALPVAIPVTLLVGPAPHPTEAGVFYNGNEFALDSANARNGSTATVYFNYITPAPGDIPVSGDWNGTGTSKIGIYRPSTGTWWLNVAGNGVFTAGIDKVYQFGGIAGDVPVTGDWTGSGFSKIGIVRPFAAGTAPALWILDTNGDGIMEAGSLDIPAFGYGGVLGDVPVVGDWSGNGVTKVGIVREFAPGTAPALWILDTANTHVIGNGSQIFGFGGIAGDVPVTGDWNGTGTFKVGDFRQGFLWVIDNNGTAPTVPGGTQTVVFPLGGISGNVPITGKWH